MPDIKEKKFFQLRDVGLDIYRVQLLWLFNKALQHGEGELLPVDLINLAYSQDVYIFGGFIDNRLSLALAVEFVQSPRKKWLNIIACSGQGKEFYDFMPELIHWASFNGATAIRGYVKEPMMRFARRQGFREIYRICEKELPHA